MNIFPRLTQQKNVSILRILQKVFVLPKKFQTTQGQSSDYKQEGLQLFDSQIQQYEEIIYAERRDALLKAQGSRFVYLQKLEINKSLSLQIIMTNSDSLINFISTLHEKERILRKQLSSINTNNTNALAYTQDAIGAILELKFQLLREAAVLQAILATRLQLWYQGQAELEFERRRRYYHGIHEPEMCFRELCASFTNLEKTIKTYIPSHANVQREQLKLREQLLRQRLLRKQRKSQEVLHSSTTTVDQTLQSDLFAMQQYTHQALASISVESVESLLTPLKMESTHREQNKSSSLTLKQVVEIDRAYQSPWASDRYRASLITLKLQYARHQHLYIEDNQTLWLANRQLQQVVMAKQQLLNRWYNLFYNKTRRLYTSFSLELQRKQRYLARQQLKALLNAANDHLLNPDNTQHLLSELSSELQQAWQQLMTLCQYPTECAVGRLEEALNSVCALLNIQESERSPLLLKLIQHFIQPAVNSIHHPAYHLLRRYCSTVAHTVLQPKMEDILAHLQNDSAWAELEAAQAELVFLLTGQSELTFELTFKADLFSQTLLNYALFAQSIPLKSWARLTAFAEHYQLSGLSLSRMEEDVKLWCEGEDPACSLQRCILSKLSVEAVQPLLSADWIERLAATSRMIDYLSDLLVNTQHTHYPEAKTFFEALVNCLLTLSQDAQVLKTPDFKQLLLHCYYHPVLQASALRESIKLTLQAWESPKFVSYQPPVLKNETTKSSTPSVERIVLNKLITAVRQTIHLVTELSALPSIKPYAKGLPCLLTRSELTVLAGINYNEEVYRADHSSLERSLKVLQTSRFVDQRTQQQACNLLGMIQVTDQSVRLASVDHYCLCQSTQGQHTQGFFAANDETLDGRNVRESLFQQYQQK